jgi:MoaA/NifB/PqqE/SkfB family radical SAM enzyme
MALVRFHEWLYQYRHLNRVNHITLDPRGPGLVRIHLVPPKRSLNADTLFVVFINGQDILPVTLSWAILLSAFIDSLAPYDGKEFMEGALEEILSETVRRVQKVYRGVKAETLRDDLARMVDAFTAIARGQKPQEEIGCVSLGEYASHMSAPHRMDLMVSAMQKDGAWHCNQKCLHCYAAGQPLSKKEELDTKTWKHIIHMLQKAGIPQITFTGGEPTLRSDLAELVKEAQWFVTRLNTNGVLLTRELCRNLFEAELDSVQITLYSSDPDMHNTLVGSDHFSDTAKGIQNALEAGLNVSINTPLCTHNADYVKTLAFVKDLGIRYVTCSGLIVTGNADKEPSRSTQLAPETLCEILAAAKQYCNDNSMEIAFTSPGWVKEEKLLELGYDAVPSCGACLSNMAIAPNGDVIPCQSWLSDAPLGNILQDRFSRIWDSETCKGIRAASAKMEHICPLRKEEGRANS